MCTVTYHIFFRNLAVFETNWSFKKLTFDGPFRLEFAMENNVIQPLS